MVRQRVGIGRKRIGEGLGVTAEERLQLRLRLARGAVIQHGEGIDDRKRRGDGVLAGLLHRAKQPQRHIRKLIGVQLRRGHRLLIREFQLQKAIQHRDGLGARAGLERRPDRSVRRLAAADDAGADGEAHGLARPRAHGVIFVEGQPRLVAPDVFVLIPQGGIAPEERGEHLARHNPVGVEVRIVHAVRNVVGSGPVDRGGKPRVGGYVDKAARLGAQNAAAHAVQDRDDHGAGHGAIGIKRRTAHAVDIALLIQISRGILVPRARGHVGKRGLPCGESRGQTQQERKREQKRKDSFFHIVLLSVHRSKLVDIPRIGGNGEDQDRHADAKADRAAREDRDEHHESARDRKGDGDKTMRLIPVFLALHRFLRA